MNRGVFLPRVVVRFIREVGASVWDRALNLCLASRWIPEGSEPFTRGRSEVREQTPESESESIATKGAS